MITEDARVSSYPDPSGRADAPHNHAKLRPFAPSYRGVSPVPDSPATTTAPWPCAATVLGALAKNGGAELTGNRRACEPVGNVVAGQGILALPSSSPEDIQRWCPPANHRSGAGRVAWGAGEALVCSDVLIGEVTGPSVHEHEDAAEREELGKRAAQEDQWALSARWMRPGRMPESEVGTPVSLVVSCSCLNM